MSQSINVINQIRAFSPRPGAFSYLNSKRLRIYDAIEFLDSEPCLDAGDVFVLNKKRLLIGTIDSPVEIKQLQLEGKNVMDTASFINGYKNLLENESKLKRR